VNERLKLVHHFAGQRCWSPKLIAEFSRHLVQKLGSDTWPGSGGKQKGRIEHKPHGFSPRLSNTSASVKTPWRSKWGASFARMRCKRRGAQMPFYRLAREVAFGNAIGPARLFKRAFQGVRQSDRQGSHVRNGLSRI